MLNQLDTQPALIDQVHERLVAAIVSGALAPGQRVTQESVAEMLGVSRQPVSHALQILKRRGLVTEHGKRGLAVSPMDDVMVRDLYQVRAALDGLAAGLAAHRVRTGTAGADEFEDLDAALEAGRRLGKNVDMMALVQADVAFHGALYRLSGNDQIAATITEQWPHFMRSMGMVLALEGARTRIWREHASIAGAVQRGDHVEAERLARAHTARATERLAAQRKLAAKAD